MTAITTDTNPLISIIVPVHQVAAHVEEAIASLRAQTLTDFEALVVDDGSTDGSGDLAAAAFGDDPRFVLIRQENRGLSAARNRGLDRARGQFVAFLDGDDAFDPRYLAEMHAAIERDGTDWAACGVALVYPDGARNVHPGIHGHTDHGPAPVIPMDDARMVARLYPSAWNKLYRRSFLGATRYPEGSWYEDHEVFWTLAVQGRPLSYCPDPLVLHRRDRPGQITGADSDRVFEQFAVLDRLAPVLLNSSLTHAREGFAQLATRLIHERAQVLRQRERRARFISEAQRFLARHDCQFDPGLAPDISRGLALVLQGMVPVSVVVVAGSATLSALDALDRQIMADFDLTVIAPFNHEVPDALPCGEPVQRMVPEGLTWSTLAGQLRGRSVVVLNGDDALFADGLYRLVNLIEATGAPMAFGGIERAQMGYHDGWSDNAVAKADLDRLGHQGGCIAMSPARALCLHPVVGNRIVRRSLMARLDLPVSGDPLDMQALVLGTAVLAETTGVIAHPVLWAPDLPAPVPPLDVLAARIKALAIPETGRLPSGWQSVLFLRFARFRAVTSGGRNARYWLEVLTRLLVSGLPRLRAARPDPETPRWMRMVLQPWRVITGRQSCIATRDWR
jgi:glycosyltransferase involved in cell wall biosynthesis